MLGIVYKTTNLINQKVYIGQHINNDPKYLGSGLNITKAIKKYGKENFVRQTLIVCTSQEELDAYEELFIEMYSSTNKNIGYNIMPGTVNGFNGVNPMHIKEVKEKAKASMKGNGKGIPKSEEHKRKNSLSQMGPKNHMYGKHLTPETKEKLSAHFKGLMVGDKNPMYGKTWKENEERLKKHKEKLSKKVESYNPETGEIIQKFNSINEACDFCKGSVGACLRGKSLTAGGFRWRYSI